MVKRNRAELLKSRVKRINRLPASPDKNTTCAAVFPRGEMDVPYVAI